MSTGSAIAVIDLGKTNAKVVLIEAATGRELGQETKPNTPLLGAPYAHADVEGLWAFFLSALKRLDAVSRIGAISITTHGATAALVDGDGLVLPVLDYEDKGPDASAQAYAAVRPGFAETLSPRLPVGLNLGAQLFWLSQRFPDDFGRATAILAYPQYWAWRLCGALASEATSLGCHTDLWRPVEGGFSSLVTTMGWQALFPPVRPAASALGTLRPALAAETGLAHDVAVGVGIHDSNASLVTHLKRPERTLSVVSSGTWTILMTIGGEVCGLEAARDSLANVDAEGRPVPTARFMGGREFAVLAGDCPSPSPEDIETVLRNKAMALPSFVPGVGPFPGREGGWTVDVASLSPGERAAAASLYLALVSAECLTLCGIGERIVIEGPLARNALYAAALAGLTGRHVELSGDATGTTLGAALLLGATPERRDGEPVAPLAGNDFAEYCRQWQTMARADGNRTIGS